jgi:hypothetical protein
MENKRLIAVENLCTHYQIEISFVHSLNDYGLISIIELETGQFIEEDDLADIEKMMRLHYELDINMAGLDAISHLLKKLQEREKDLLKLKKSLDLDEMGGF